MRVRVRVRVRFRVRGRTGNDTVGQRPNYTMKEEGQHSMVVNIHLLKSITDEEKNDRIEETI